MTPTYVSNPQRYRKEYRPKPFLVVPNILMSRFKRMSDDAFVVPPDPVVGGVGAGVVVTGGAVATGVVDVVVEGVDVGFATVVLLVGRELFCDVCAKDETDGVTAVGTDLSEVGLMTTLDDIGILLTNWSSCCCLAEVIRYGAPIA